MNMKEAVSRTLISLILTASIFLTACQPLLLWQIAAYVGEILIWSGGGYVIEAVVDSILQSGGSNSNSKQVLPFVITDSDDPLRGTWSTSMEFERNNPLPVKTFIVVQPKMVRDSQTSKWELDPEVKRSLAKAFEEGI